MDGERQATSVRSSPSPIPTRDEIDFQRLRRERLERLQDSMRAHDVAVGLFFKQANIRYATGTEVMGLWSGPASARCCVVAQDGSPVLFEYPGSVHVSLKLLEQVRPMPQDARSWVTALREVLDEIGARHERLAVDQLDVRHILALSGQGFSLEDSTPAVLAAREVKTEDEIGLAKFNGAIGDAMLQDLEAAISPGIREYELFAVLANTLHRNQGEAPFTRLTAAGRNTNPWMSEAHDNRVMPGDLVGVDTDANGFEGYVIDVSRTFLCGDHPTAGQRDAYHAACDAVREMRELLRPGLSYEDWARSVPRLPERYREQRYSILAHGSGLEIEDPTIPHAVDVQAGVAQFPEGVIKPGMVLCLECYTGEVGATYGVKLEDQVLITDTGSERLSNYPYDHKLLEG